AQGSRGGGIVELKNREPDVLLSIVACRRLTRSGGECEPRIVPGFTEITGAGESLRGLVERHQIQQIDSNRDRNRLIGGGQRRTDGLSRLVICRHRRRTERRTHQQEQAAAKKSSTHGRQFGRRNWKVQTSSATFDRRQPRMIFTRCVAPSSASGICAGPAARALPSSSTLATPRLTLRGFSTAIS